MAKQNLFEARHLLEKYLSGQCDENEKAKVEEWYLTFNQEGFDQTDDEIISDFIELQKRLKQIPDVAKPKRRRYIAAAAAVLFLLLTTGLLWQKISKDKRAASHTVITHDILPGTDRAQLSIDGQAPIELDGQKEGLISRGLALRYGDGTAITETNKVQLVTLSTPIAGQFQVTLPDGTKAWLNALSSIRYPTAFDGPERSVHITGEVYLAVSKNRAKPFIIYTEQQRIEVLGTSFNVNAYQDDDQTLTTLVSGSLRVTDAKSAMQVTLKPGQQAIVGKEKNIQVNTINVEDSYAWKNGLYILNEEPLSQYARKIERWYDVQVDMGPYGNTRLSAIIPRDAKLSEVLQAIELKSDVRFNIEGRRVTAMR